MKTFVTIFILAMLAYYGVRLHGWLGKGSGPDMIVDTRLAGIVDEWKKDMEDNDIFYSTKFNMIHEIRIVEDSVVTGGNAAYADLFQHTIYISESTADKGRLSTKAAVYHELGHYVFYFDHVEGDVLMNEYSHDESDLKKNWDTLLKIYLVRCKKNENYAKL